MPIAKAKIVSIVNMDIVSLHTAEIVTMDTAKHAWIFEYGIWLAASGMLAATIVLFGGAACPGADADPDNASIFDWFTFIRDFYFDNLKGAVARGFYLLLMLLSVGIIIANWAGSGLNYISTGIFRIVSVICFIVVPMVLYWIKPPVVVVQHP